MKHKKAAAALKKECKAIADLDVAAPAPLGGKTLLELVEGARAACVSPALTLARVQAG